MLPAPYGRIHQERTAEKTVFGASTHAFIVYSLHGGDAGELCGLRWTVAVLQFLNLRDLGPMLCAPSVSILQSIAPHEVSHRMEARIAAHCNGRPAGRCVAGREMSTQSQSAPQKVLIRLV